MSDQEYIEPVAPEGAVAVQDAALAGAQQRRPGKRFPRRKLCFFCGQNIDYIDYKDTKLLRKFVSDRGKILPRRMTGTCAFHQRMVTTAVKRARVLALLPFKAE